MRRAWALKKLRRGDIAHVSLYLRYTFSLSFFFSVLFTVLCLGCEELRILLFMNARVFRAGVVAFLTLTTAGYLNLRRRRRLNVSVIEIIQEPVVDVSHSLALHLAGGRFAA